MEKEKCLASLTMRQKVVLFYFQKGDSEKQVALKLGISTNGVHYHARHIRRKYGVHSRAQLLAKFVPAEILEACKVG
jgi:DNA-binding CsgD family transcriptional regulator